MSRFLTPLFLLLCSVCPLAVHSQSLGIDNDYPVENGVLVLDANGGIQTLYATQGLPNDVEVMPSQSEFAVATQSGELLILNGQGERVFQANFESLDDVDVLGQGERFLLSSRYGNRVFIFDRAQDSRQTLTYAAQGPVDADLLPNGHYLITEAPISRVVEVTDGGDVVWSFSEDLKQPMDAIRLDNGNTLISDFDNHRVIEVTSDGQIVHEAKGFEHPGKIHRLPDGSILVADSDRQRLAMITPDWQFRAIREKINYIKAVTYVPPLNFYLCAVQNRFPPPQVKEDPSASSLPALPNAVSAPARPLQLGQMFSSPYLWLGAAAVLWFLSATLAHWGGMAAKLLMLAYIMALGVGIQAQLIAAADPEHIPPGPFWLAVFLLFLFSYRDARGVLRGAEIWRHRENRVRFPFSASRAVLLAVLALILFYLQGSHLRPGLIHPPWYVVIGGWLLTLYLLLRGLFANWTEFSTWVMQSNRSVGRLWFEKNGKETAAIQTQSPALHRRWELAALGALMLLAAALYTINATGIPTDFHGDEGEVAMQGLQVRATGNWNFFNLGWYQIPHFFYLMPAWVMWLFGDNLFGIRMAGALTGLASIPFFYLLARRILYPSAAVLATFLLITCTYFVHFSRIGIGYNQTTFFTVLVLYLMIRGVQDADSRSFGLAGLFAGIGMLSYQATHLLAPLVAVSLPLLWLMRSLRFSQMILYGLCFAFTFLVTAAPLLGVYWIDPQAGKSRAASVSLFAEEGRRMIQGEYPGITDMSTVVGQQIKRSLLAPISFEDRSPYLVNRRYGGMLDAIPAVCFAAGALLMLALSWRHPAALLLLVWIAATMFAGSAMTNHAPSYQRLVGLVPLLLLVAAPVLHGALLHISRTARWPAGVRASVTAALLVLLLVMGMNRYFHRIQSSPQLLDEWTRIARYIDDAGPTRYIYFLGPPHVYFDYGTIKFLAPDKQGEDVRDPAAFLERNVTRKGPVTFLMVRENRRYLPELRRKYPDGREEHWYNSLGSDPFTTYTVNF